jgi:hypothetical protein
MGWSRSGRRRSGARFHLTAALALAVAAVAGAFAPPVLMFG